MALVNPNRVKETTETTGTGTYTLEGATGNFQGFTAVGDGNTCYYCCTDGTQFEIGIGTFTASGTTLARTTILNSTNSNNAINWSSGEKDIFVTLPSSKLVFEDASNNVAIGNNITVGGTVDGRDLATDGTKLDGIEASADVTDATNVTAAGALMDSEVTNLAQVKAFDSSDYATAAQGSTADAALPKAGGQMTGNITMSGSETVDGRDLSVDGAKLDGIEASADVTDTTNVVAALTAGTNVTIAGDGTISSAHPNISAASSSDNSGRTYIQDITLDSDGHVTGIATATETVVNTDTNTTYSAGNGLGLSGTQFYMTGSYSGSFTASGNVTAYSDEKLKDNIEPIENPIQKLKAIQGVTYNRNDIEGNPRHTGVVAQQVERVLPEVVMTNDDGIKTVAYGNMVGLLIEAIKEQQDEIERLRAILEG
tara:strand:- start:189 stop:1466 length:1278 start_codon:yes stop_codon:yes gene_type:complete